MAEHRTADESKGSKSLTNAFLRPLRWKVIGTARNGQMIEIFSARLTIGSAPQCTLQLRAAGVGPLQCLIVREPNGPVVRSLSQDTLLNGQSFRQQPLHTGDRLQLGSIELELCDDARPIVANETAPSQRLFDDSALSTWTDSKSQRPLECLSQFDRLEKGVNQLQDIEQFSLIDLVATGALPAANHADNAQNKSHEQVVDETRLKTQLDLVNAQHVQAQTELAKLRTEWDALQTRCEGLTSSHRAVEEKLHSLQLELERQDHNSQAAAEQYRQFSETHGMTNEEAELLKKSVGRLCEQQLEAKGARAALEKSLGTEQKLRSELERRLKQQSAQVAELREHYLSLQANFEQLRSERRIAATVTTTAPAQSNESTTPTDLESRTEHPFAAASGSPNRRLERDWLAQQVASVETEPVSQPLEENSNFTTARAEYELTDMEGTAETTLATGIGCSPAACLPENASSQLDGEFGQLHETQETFGSETDGSTTENSGTSCETDVFSRLSRAGIWKFAADAEANTEDASCPSGEQSSGEQTSDEAHLVTDLDVLEDHAGETNEPVADDGWVATTSASDDSIEAYMQRLLQRVRGDSDEPVTTLRSYVPEVTHTPQTVTSEKPAEAVRATGATVLTESEYQPRSQAPEVTANFAAMREIGNDHRQKSILKHAQQTWTDRTNTMMAASVGGLAFALASFFYLDTHTEFAAAGIFAGFGVAVFWLWQAFRCRRRLVDSMRPHVNEVQSQEANTESAEPNTEARVETEVAM